jgi:hypothetical protein
MAKARRKHRWLMWLSAAGLSLTLAAAVFSEFAAVSWLERSSGIANRFVLHKSSVMVIYRTVPDQVDRLGSEFFSPGWTVVRGYVPEGFTNRWRPALSRDSSVWTAHWYVVLPLWIPMVLFGAGVWFGRKRRGWRGEGVCRACGYDMRGSAGRVCPECGGST